MKILKCSFYLQAPAKVAKDLLGKILVHKSSQGTTSGVIVETEAYYGDKDPASFAYQGKRTPKSELMYERGGTSFVYFIYGNHYLLNVATGREELPRAILIRAVEPLEGIELMKRRRKIDSLFELTNGPGKLTSSFGITKKENGLDITKSEKLFIANGENKKFEIVSKPRIGIKKGGDKLLCFYIKDNRYISKR